MQLKEAYKVHNYSLERDAQRTESVGIQQIYTSSALCSAKICCPLMLMRCYSVCLASLHQWILQLNVFLLCVPFAWRFIFQALVEVIAVQLQMELLMPCMPK